MAEPFPTLEAMSDLCTPWCVHVVATLRIAQHVSDGVDDLPALAAAAGCDADYLGRVMRHLAKKGMFHESDDGRFSLGDTGRDLLQSGWQVGLDLGGIGGRMALAWGTLLDAVRSGAPAYGKLFGRPFWEDLDAHPDIARSFESLMGPAGHGTPDAAVLLADDWDVVRTVVDVGGSLGGLLVEIVRAHANLRGILVELPRTAERARESVRASGLADRIEVVGQSFFEPLPRADLYVLSKIVSNWGDRETTEILRRCAEAAEPGGRVVVIGGVSSSSEPAPISIESVLVGGKIDTLADFERLASAAGLDISRSGNQPSGRFVVECRKSASDSRTLQK